MMTEPVLEGAARLVRRLLADPRDTFAFRRPDNAGSPSLRQTGIYVHVPFCASLCPYCPYNRVPWDRDLATRYLDAVLREIGFQAERFPGLEVTSVYFGGGTPTVFPEGMARIAEALRSSFRLTGPLCTETHPADLTREKTRLLRAQGFSSVSLGVESFQPRLLSLIGRHYGPPEISRALNWLAEEGFPSVNIDLMFALPTETMRELDADLREATSILANQITAYPLFTFPYSTVGRYRKLARVAMPRLALRRKMYYRVYDTLAARGYRRVSVWSFQKTAEAPRYSSVTRERYLGFGPGAGSYYGPLFTLNTFSVPAYCDSVARRGHAVALEMPFSRTLQVLYDFYWRLYDTFIPETRSLETLEYRTTGEGKLMAIVTAARMLGMMQTRAHGYTLTRRGSLWMHLAQNYFSLGAIDRIWTAARADAWPMEIRF